MLSGDVVCLITVRLFARKKNSRNGEYTDVNHAFIANFSLVHMYMSCNAIYENKILTKTKLFFTVLQLPSRFFFSKECPAENDFTAMYQMSAAYKIRNYEMRKAKH